VYGWAATVLSVSGWGRGGMISMGWVLVEGIYLFY